MIKNHVPEKVLKNSTRNQPSEDGKLDPANKVTMKEETNTELFSSHLGTL